MPAAAAALAAGAIILFCFFWAQLCFTPRRRAALSYALCLREGVSDRSQSVYVARRLTADAPTDFCRLACCLLVSYRR